MTTAVATKSDRDLFKEVMDAALPEIAKMYVERMHVPDVPTEDLRKAVELGVKVHTMDKEKAQSLMTVHWVIDGGNVTMEVVPGAAQEASDDAIDVQAKEVKEVLQQVQPTPAKTKSSPGEPAAPDTPITPETAFLSTFVVAENLLADLE